jgi:FMN reductase
MLTASTVDRTAADPQVGSRQRVLGIGGTLRTSSSSELALRCALRRAAEAGAETEIITARDLNLPMYDPATGTADSGARRLLSAARTADKIVISTPGYHGGMSGLLKNALDYFQELAADEAPYLDGRAVGCIVTAAGWQAGSTALTSLRDTVHALRAWPTPLGVVINSAQPQFGPDGEALDPKVDTQLRLMTDQLITFAPVARSRR